jgi:hypothetical protein
VLNKPPIGKTTSIERLPQPGSFIAFPGNGLGGLVRIKPPNRTIYQGVVVPEGGEPLEHSHPLVLRTPAA